MIRVVLPTPLRTLAHTQGAEVQLDVAEPPTLASVLTALESTYPMLRGTLRDQTTHQRRPFIRFFACGQDLSHDPASNCLPPEVASGKEPLLVVGAMAGG